MKKYFIISLGLFFLLGCSINKSVDKNKFVDKRDFVKFVNENKLTIKRDDEVVKDMYFALQIPKSLSENKIKISSFFLQELKFDKNQKIILLYIPDKKYKLDRKILNYSFKTFKDELSKLDIYHDLESMEFIENRRFGLVLLEDNFFAIYINIKKENIENYNYSINSINLNL